MISLDVGTDDMICCTYRYLYGGGGGLIMAKHTLLQLYKTQRRHVWDFNDTKYDPIAPVLGCLSKTQHKSSPLPRRKTFQAYHPKTSATTLPLQGNGPTCPRH